MIVVDLHGNGDGGRRRRGRRGGDGTFVICRGTGRSPPGLTLAVAVADKGGKAGQDLSLPTRGTEPTRVEAATHQHNTRERSQSVFFFSSGGSKKKDMLTVT